MPGVNEDWPAERYKVQAAALIHDLRRVKMQLVFGNGIMEILQMQNAFRIRC